VFFITEKAALAKCVRLRGGVSRYRTLLLLGAVVIMVGLASLIGTGVVRPTQPTPRATTPPTLDLSGTLLGTCNGTSNGFCTLTLTRTANGLEGTFLLPSPPGKPLDIEGNLTGSTITL
jgi:hypothetical protein